MKRVFPTQLRVVQSRAELNAVEESKKGYYDPESKNSVRIGVCGTRSIVLSSPGNWYRHYVFTLDHIPEDMRKNDEGQLDDDYGVWRIVAQLIKTECGRKVIHREGQKYLTLAGMNKDMAKQFYYLTKHTLTKLGVEFKLTSTIFSPFGSATTAPDVRDKPKRKRHRNNTHHQMAAFHANAWQTVM